MYPTRRMIFVMLGGAPVSLVAAIIAPSLWLVGGIWVAFAIGLFVLDALLSAGPFDICIALTAPGAFGIARSQPANVALTFAKRAPSQVELTLDVGPKLKVAPARQICAEGSEAAFMLTPLRRGPETIEAVWARWKGPLGLCWKQRRNETQRSVAIMPDIAAVKDEAVLLFRRETSALGRRLELHRGQGSEFNALKEFHPGMDRRSIDWKQSAKHSKLLAREFQAEENLHIVFALDTGRLLCEPLAGMPKIDRAIQAFLLLAYVALRLGDRVGLYAFDERPMQSSGTVAGLNAFRVLQQVAAAIDYSTAETNFTLGLTQLSVELEHRSIVIVFADFSDSTGAELMIENVARLLERHTVLFVAFRDEELEALVGAEPTDPQTISRAVFADRILSEREAVRVRLRRIGVNVIDVKVDGIGPRLLEAYLREKQGYH
jgi:uncharacterized protein (DUF58 family)